MVNQYYAEIIGRIEAGIIKSASGEVLINGNRQYYLKKTTRGALIAKYNEMEALEQNIKNEVDVEESKNKIKQLKIDLIRLKKEERLTVEKVYEIVSHDTFLNRIFIYKEKNFTPGEFLPKLAVPEGLLIIDEIQNLVSSIGTKYRKLLYALRFYANKRFKVITLTGTPIYDKPYEFGLLMNLLRPRLVFPDGHEAFSKIFINDAGNFTNKELFKKMCSGYISYFKGGNPEAYPYKKTTVMHHTMNPYQYSMYKDALIDEVDDDRKNQSKERNEVFTVSFESTESKNDKASTGIFNNSNLISNIALPEPKISSDIVKHLTRDSTLQASVTELRHILKAQEATDRHLPEEKQIEKMLSLVSNFSEKFSKVAELILNCEGPVFVYSNYVYYGVESMSIVMNALGFDEFPKTGRRGSYFVWKGQAKEELIPKAKELFNSYENRDGSRLKIMFGTQTVMEGVDFKNVRQVHILDPWWNDSRMQQVIARAIRLCSHKDLPANKRVVDVFIHLSTLGSAESIYTLKIKKLDRQGINEVESTIKSMLQLENPNEPDEKNWVFREAYITLDKENEATLKNAYQTFYASQIIPGTIKKLSDPSLTKAFGSYKKLDTIGIQQYMYSRALSKLSLNRQFEKCIKEVAVDCNLNKNGNIIRLDENYYPTDFDGVYRLEYENYTNGDRYLRNGVPELYKIPQILSNLAKDSQTFEFIKLKDDSIVKLNKSLIIPENITCEDGNYKFDGEIPQEIVRLSLNKELIPLLMQMTLQDFKNYFYNIQINRITPEDPKLNTKINNFLSKDAAVEKQRIIDKFVEYGIGDEETWQFFPLDLLKKEYARFKFNK